MSDGQRAESWEVGWEVEHWDAVVIGAGPGGAAAAGALAQRGVSVLLVDKARFPRHKVCGCCLSRDALARLARLGLADLPARLGAEPLHTLHLAAGGPAGERHGERVARLRLAGGAAVSRRALDMTMTQWAQQHGVTFLDHTHAQLHRPALNAGAAEPRHRLTLRRGRQQRTVTADVLLVADGLAGRFLASHPAFTCRAARRSRLGVAVIAPEAPTFYQPGTVYMACGVGGYLGLVRLEDGRLDLAAALDLSFVQAMGGPANAAADLLTQARLPPVPALETLTWRGTPALTRKRQPLAAHGVFVLGDSAGYVEPFTGEGIAWALACGEQVAPLAQEAVRGWRADLARQWQRQHHRLLARRQLRCRWIAHLLRRPRLVRQAVGLAGALPTVAERVVDAVTGPARIRTDRFAPPHAAGHEPAGGMDFT